MLNFVEMQPLMVTFQIMVMSIADVAGLEVLVK